MDGFQESRTKGKVSLDKRCIYLLVVILIVLSVVVGVVVWYITDSSCSADNVGTSAPFVVDSTTSKPSTTTQGSNEQEPWRNLRLPQSVIPVHYDITLYPDFYEDHGWFYGNETIEVDIMKETNVVLIHSNFLNITSTALRSDSGESYKIKNTFWYEENQFWVIQTASMLPVSKIYFDLQFDGSLTRAIVGFYKSTYQNSITKEMRSLATSKFQPVDARRAFPCFDEPNIKAEYTIRLVHRPEYLALSNMPNVSTLPWEHNPSLHKTDFQRSVKMSTYLVCFIVCDFNMLVDRTRYDTEIRVFATPDRIEQAAYSLHVMKVTMEKFQDLFKVPFPLPKNDMIAIPDFVSGAMEHWGLITYREVNMLYDSNEASAANKQRVAVVVAHEIAHMWFGNIVTMEWWDDLWLNEGFASFVAPIGVDAAEPDWMMLDQMVVDDVQPVMVTDAGVNSHPIVVDVNHPDQITEVFDAISYNKGASVIRMLQEIVGREHFFSGIEQYLTKYKWDTATTQQLWDELGQVPAGYTVESVMDTWTRQMGLPYINVSFSEKGQVCRVHAAQKRFLVDKDMTYDASESPYGYMWFVQLDYMTNSGGKEVKWMTKDDQSITFDIAMDMSDSSNLVKFNANQTGFYRVNYPDEIWQRFATLLYDNGPSEVPSAADRAGLIDDAFNMARGGYISYEVAMGMTRYLDQERHHLPWDSAYNGINYMIHMFENSGKFNALRLYFNQKVRPVMRSLTWDDGDSHLDKLMRANIIRLSCEFADSECLGNASQKFRAWLDTGATVSPNIRAYVYKYGMRTAGSDSDWEDMWTKYTTETVPQEQIKLLYGLAQTRDVWLLNRYLEYSKDPERVRTQDFFSVISYIAGNPVGRGLAWDWVRNNWEYLVNRFSIGSRSLGRLVPNIVRYFNTPFKLKEVEEFFEKYPDAGAGTRGRVQVLEGINRNIAWMNDYSDVIETWLLQHM